MANIRLDETIDTSSVAPDNLINSIYPPATFFGVKLKAGQGILKRGSLLARGTDGKMTLIATATTGKANCILSDNVDTGTSADADDLFVTAYKSGCFNSDKIIVGDSYTITSADKEALRNVDIIINDAI